MYLTVQPVSKKPSRGRKDMDVGISDDEGYDSLTLTTKNDDVGERRLSVLDKSLLNKEVSIKSEGGYDIFTLTKVLYRIVLRIKHFYTVYYIFLS